MPKTHPKGSKGRGLSYEKKVALAIPAAEHSQWFKYLDDCGLGWCQPDLIYWHGGDIFVLECKLTDKKEAYKQILGLYKPILEKLYQARVFGLVVARNLTWQTEKSLITSSLSDAILLARRLGTPRTRQQVPLLHWLGRGPIDLGPPLTRAQSTAIALAPLR